MPIEEKLDEIMSLIRVLDTKIQFVQSDLDELRQTELAHIKACVEQLASNQLEKVQEQSKTKWTVERL